MRAALVDVAAIVILHALAACAIRALGFDHVSDDDFARVTIAQTFAHAPRLDPSGTSWLPFPFWALGGVMLVLGRSLAVARAASVALASAALALPYVALRRIDVPRGRALGAVALFALSPWSLWLGAATVPESFTASLTAAAAIALAHARGDARREVPFALAMLAACLSRYEAWPVAAVLALVLVARAARARGADRVVLVALSLVAAAGPLAWMGWNAVSHGDALDFFVRVARFKRGLGEGATDTLAALWLYPRLFVTTRPDLTAAGACALLMLRRSDVRARWGVPLACAAAELAFLAYGNARDGAPAHHPARVLLAAFFVVAAFAVDALGAALPRLVARARGAVIALAALLALGWAANLRGLWWSVPGRSPSEDRRAQIARGRALQGAASLVVRPCAYEHFALLAAYGAPERATTIAPEALGEVTSACPQVEAR